MIVIADASPLHYLILLDLTDILPRLYGRVIVPPAVAGELQAKNAPAGVKRWITNPPDWLEVRPIVVPPDPALGKLDAGEREAITIAEALQANLLILDERLGRREAERRNLRVTGTLGVLDEAAEAGFVDLREALQRLKMAGFYLDAKLIQFALDRDANRARRKSSP